METEIRFVFEKGNCRIEELNWERDVKDEMYADWGTIEGYMEVYKNAKIKPKSIEELDKMILEDTSYVELAQ